MDGSTSAYEARLSGICVQHIISDLTYSNSTRPEETWNLRLIVVAGV